MSEPLIPYDLGVYEPPGGFRNVFPRPVLYECDCCERRNVPAKSKGIGYLCDDCLGSWTWDYGRHPAEQDPPDHHAGRACPFKVACEG